MITIRPGSHVHTLLTILSFVGEYPVTALGLLGSVRSYKDLIHKLTMPQEFRIHGKDERFTCRLLTVSGKGKRKTIRLHKSALPLLKHRDEDSYDNYMYEFDEHTFFGNARHVERNHLVAETAVMCMKAGIEANPLYTSEVMEDEVRRLRLTEPCFYFARELKRANDYELNKICFTRIAGSIVYPGGAYAVYNYHEEMLKRMGEGEVKIKHHLHTIFTPMMSYEFPLREAAIIFERDYDVALNMLKEMKETQKMDNGLFYTYKDIFFIPMDDFGARLLRVLTTWNWQERILNALFDPKVRSHNRGSFTYDAHENGEFQFSFLDGNIWRLLRFREAILNRGGKFKIICYPEQLPFLREYIGNLARFSTVTMENVEQVLDIKRKSLP